MLQSRENQGQKNLFGQTEKPNKTHHGNAMELLKHVSSLASTFQKSANSYSCIIISIHSFPWQCHLLNRCSITVPDLKTSF